MLEYCADLLLGFLVNVILACPGALVRASINWLRYRGRKPFRVLLREGNAGIAILIGAALVCIVCAVMMMCT